MKSALPTIEEIEAELSEVAKQAEAGRAKGKSGGAVREKGSQYGQGAVLVVDKPFAAAAGVETPFGVRWGASSISLTAGQLASLTTGKTIAIDVQEEYVVFVQAEPLAKKRPSSRKGGKMSEFTSTVYGSMPKCFSVSTLDVGCSFIPRQAPFIG